MDKDVCHREIEKFGIAQVSHGHCSAIEIESSWSKNMDNFHQFTLSAF